MKDGIVIKWYELSDGSMDYTVHYNGNEIQPLKIKKATGNNNNPTTPPNLFLLIEPLRHKSPDTKLEELEIILYDNESDFIDIDNKKDKVSFSCGLLSLDKDMEQIKSYGTGLKSSNIKETVQVINDYYRKINVIDDYNVDRNILDKKKVDEIVSLCCNYIIDKDIKESEIGNNKLYNIPVTTFNELIANSDFYYFDLKLVKQKLKVEKFTHCNGSSNDYNVAGQGKVISFYSNKIGDIIGRLAKVKQKETA